MKSVRYILIIIAGAGLLACSSYKVATHDAERIRVDGSASDVEMDSLVAPYRRALQLEMGRVIGTAESDMAVARPNSLMGQWVADVVLQYGRDSLLTETERQLPVIALLNTGGLRASFSKGQLTVGDVYKVMPFDNQIVALKLPVEKLAEIQAYIQRTGGEPIAGFKLVNGSLLLDNAVTNANFFWIITSDFLANGGDKMYFFGDALEKKMTSKLLRDLLLEEIVRKQNIQVLLEERVQL